MNQLVFGFSISLGFAFVVGALGCAGQLTDAEAEKLCNEHPTCAGSGGPSGSGGATGAGGTGAGGTAMPLPVDMCVTTSLKSCQTAAVCHVGTTPQAGLNLSNDALTKNYKALFFNKTNAGSAGITMPMDPAGCVAGAFKLIDSANPMNSLMYTKAFPMSAPLMPPCGARMPVIEAGNPFTDADRMCLLNWINSVITASQ